MEVCQTPICHADVEYLKGNLAPDFSDQNIWTNQRICDDFETFVCKGYWDKLKPPQGSGLWDTGLKWEMELRTERRLVRIIQTPDYDGSGFGKANEVAKENFQKVKVAYEACGNWGRQVKPGERDHLQKTLEKVWELFPVDDNETDQKLKPEDYENLHNTIVYLEERGVTVFQDISVLAESGDPDYFWIHIEDGADRTLTVPRGKAVDPDPAYDKTTILEALFAAFYQKLSPGTPMSESFGARMLAESVLNMERLMAKHLYATDTNKIGHQMSRDPHAKIQQYVQEVLDQEREGTFFTINEIRKLGGHLVMDRIIETMAPGTKGAYVRNPGYVRAVDLIVFLTQKPVLRAFILWKVIHQLSDFLHGPEEAGFAHWGKGITHKSCIWYVDQQLGWILSQLYVKKHLPNEDLTVIGEMATAILFEAVARIEKLPWLDKDAKARAITKIKSLRISVGAPPSQPNVRDPEDVRDFYSNLEITDVFLDNQMSYRKWKASRKWAMLANPVDPDAWTGLSDTLLQEFSKPTDLNIAYSAIDNKIILPAAALQFPWFHRELPSYLWATLASIIAHEVAHAIERPKLDYDENGRFEPDAVSKEVRRKLYILEQAFVRQFDKFEARRPDGTLIEHPVTKQPPFKLNGAATMYENIADTTGLELAFAGYKRQQSEREKPDQLLPDMPEWLTPDHLFFVQWGSQYCPADSDETTINKVRSGVPHSPAWARIRGTVGNSRAFQKTFGCVRPSDGKPVRPVCEMWEEGLWDDDETSSGEEFSSSEEDADDDDDDDDEHEEATD